MRFEFYHSGLDDVPKLSVDGTVSNSVHFSHWQGNETPAEVKADTSTEIALNLVASPNRDQLTRGIELVTNNHFDTDGVLSVWAVLTGERALDLRDRLISAAEAGDFSELTSEDGVRASMAIQGPDPAGNDSDSGSPLAGYLNGGAIYDDARAYELLFPEVERLLTNVGDYEHLWRDGWNRVATAIESFAKGSSTVEELTDAHVSLVTLAPDSFEPGGFNPNKHATPFTAISSYAKGQLFLIATPYENGWSYRMDYPYYSWAETVVRPRIERRELTTLISRLNELETNGEAHWRLDGSEMTSAIKFLDNNSTLAASQLRPDEVANALRTELLSRKVTFA
ncbi:MAG: DUF6687 family protein [Pyrinomonadaceae bacterium]